MKSRLKIIVGLLKGNIFFKGGIFLTIASFITGLINYLFNLAVARSLGPEGYGEITTLFSYLVISSIPIGTASIFMIQKIGASENMGIYSYALYDWFLTKVKKWWLLLFIILLTTPFVPQITNLSKTVGYALPLLIVLSLLGAFYSGAYQGLHLFYWLAFIGLIVTILKLAGAGLTFFGLGGIGLIIVFILLSQVVGIMLSHVIFVRKYKVRLEKDQTIKKRILSIFQDRQLWLSAGATSILAIINNIDIIYVKKVFSAEQTGIYSSWSIFAKIILYALGPLLTLGYIFFSSKKNALNHRLVFTISFLFLLVIGVIITMIYGIFGETLVIKLFGHEFLRVIPYLEWAAYYGIGYTMMTFMLYYFLAMKSSISQLPILLLPIYLLVLFIYSESISDVMRISTYYVLITSVIFLLAFIRDYFLYNRGYDA
ncbi:MAG: hypothetical protein O3B87_04645 [bacterium]|nr:hypothetical protein [bacterium]